MDDRTAHSQEIGQRLESCLLSALMAGRSLEGADGFSLLSFEGSDDSDSGDRMAALSVLTEVYATLADCVREGLAVMGAGLPDGADLVADGGPVLLSLWNDWSGYAPFAVVGSAVRAAARVQEITGAILEGDAVEADSVLSAVGRDLFGRASLAVSLVSAGSLAVTKTENGFFIG